MKVNKNLQQYIEENIFPIYEKNDLSHNLDHIKYVINRSLNFANEVDNINYNMVYTIAAYHDIGHHIDDKNHEKISAEILLSDKNLRDFFTEDEINIMSEAVYDHRSSLIGEPRSIYGKIVSSADRNNTVEACLRRTYTYGKKLDPNATDEELFLKAYDVLTKKFGENGYAKFYFKDSVYEEFLHELRTLLSNKENYLKTQKQYINKLKQEKKI